MIRPSAASLLAYTLAMAASAKAWGGQHLVSPGDDWSELSARVRPGDEIILMPGKHRGATFDTLVGAYDKPLLVRGLDPDHPAEIDAGKDGLRVKHASHLVIKDLAISGASVSGITLSAGETANAERPGRINIRNVTIKRTGPKGMRHALAIIGLEDVRIDGCRFEGWGGSAIEIVACRDVAVEDSTFTGLVDHGQENGVRARGGSDRVRIERCRFVDAGTRAVCLGGPSLSNEFLTPLPVESAKSGVVFELTNASVQSCRFTGGQCAVVYSNAEDCVARNNTVVRPKHCVFAVLDEQDDPRFGAGKRLIWGYNLAVWDPGGMQRLVEFSPGLKPSEFFLEENLWWSGEAPEARRKLGPLPGDATAKQVFDVDPKLDADLAPTTPEAQGFGATPG